MAIHHFVAHHPAPSTAHQQWCPVRHIHLRDRARVCSFQQESASLFLQEICRDLTQLVDAAFAGAVYEVASWRGEANDRFGDASHTAADEARECQRQKLETRQRETQTHNLRVVSVCVWCLLVSAACCCWCLLPAGASCWCLLLAFAERPVAAGVFCLLLPDAAGARCWCTLFAAAASVFLS